MDLFLALLRVLYVLLFFVAVFLYLRFEWSAEGKDERGRKISNISYGIVFPLLPLGWFIIEMLNDYMFYFNYETYKLLIWFLVTALVIIHAINITVMKRMY